MKGANILIVDVSVPHWKLIADSLKFSGYRTFVASDAAAALGKISSLHFDLILIGIAVDDKDGLELIRRLKSCPGTNRTPIVVLAALATEEDESKAYAAGCDGYFLEPIDTYLFSQQLSKFLKI